MRLVYFIFSVGLFWYGTKGWQEIKREFSSAESEYEKLNSWAGVILVIVIFAAAISCLAIAFTGMRPKIIFTPL